MEYVSVKNIEKYHPGYKDGRDLKWAKLYFTVVNGDPEFEMIQSEIDKWRFVAILLLQLQAKKPLPNSDAYWKAKQFNLKLRPMSLTLQMLQDFLEVVTGNLEPCHLEKRREEKEKIREREDYSAFEECTVTAWNSFCDRFPVLPKVQSVSGTRRAFLKKRFEKADFREFPAILKAVEEQPFLLGKNDRKWKVSLDWIIKNDTNYLKILERKYVDGQDTRSIFRDA